MSFATDTIFDLFMRPEKILAHEDLPELFAPQTISFLALCGIVSTPKALV